MRYYNIHGLVDILIDDSVYGSVVKAIDFQLSHFLAKYNENKKNASRIEVKRFTDINWDNKKNLTVFHLVKGIPQKFLLDEPAQFAAEKISDGYILYSDFPFLINIFIHFLLIERGFAFVHAAALGNSKGDGILFPGPGGVGKTAIIGQMAKDGWKILGDDLVIFGKDGQAFSFLREFVLKDYHRSTYPDLFVKMKVDTKLDKIIPKLAKVIILNMPFLDLTKKILKKVGYYKQTVEHLPFNKSDTISVPVNHVFGEESVMESVKISKVLFLERYMGQEFLCQDLNEKNLLNRMFSIINHEWVRSMRRIFSLGALEVFSLYDYFTKTDEIIDSGIKDKKIKMIRIPEKATPEELYDFIKQNI